MLKAVASAAVAASAQVATEAPAGAAPAPAITCEPAVAQYPDLAEAWTLADLGTMDADSLIGAEVRTCDGEPIAIVEDVILTPTGEWTVSPVRFEAGDGAEADMALLDFDDLEIGEGESGFAVRTSYTREELRTRPEYTAPEG